MEIDGIKIDHKFLEDLSKKFGNKIKKLEKKFLKFQKKNLKLDLPNN